MNANYNESMLDWNSSYRIIPSKFPPINFFENLVDPKLMDEIFFIESLTNDRLRHEVGDISLVKKEDRVVGPGASVIMAAFTHISPHRTSRFSDGRFGVYYASKTLNTSIVETAYHREKFMQDTHQPAGELTMRVYKSTGLTQPLVDVRNDDFSSLHQPTDYTQSQLFGEKIKAQNKWGIVYNSVRDPKGECIAILRPRAIGMPVQQTRHLRYVWDGQRIASILEITQLALEGQE